MAGFKGFGNVLNAPMDMELPSALRFYFFELGNLDLAGIREAAYHF
jgi:hypothetical protein